MFLLFVVVVVVFVAAVIVLTKRLTSDSDSILLYLSTIWAHNYLALSAHT